MPVAKSDDMNDGWYLVVVWNVCSEVHFPSMESTEQHSVPWMCHVDEAQYGLRQVAEDDTLPDSWNSWEQSTLGKVQKLGSGISSTGCSRLHVWNTILDAMMAMMAMMPSFPLSFFWVTSVDIKLVGKTAELRNFRQTCQKLLLLCIQRVWQKLPHSCTWTLIPGTLWTARFLMRDWCCWWIITVFESILLIENRWTSSVTWKFEFFLHYWNPPRQMWQRFTMYGNNITSSRPEV